MGRVIKFRAWCLDNKWMDDNFFLQASNGVAHETPSKTYDTPNTEIEENPNLVVMQFTGLKDKNGVDIYEGDILKFYVDWVGQPNKEVIFNDDFHSYVLLSGKEKEWVESGSNHFKYWETDSTNIYLLHEAEHYDVEVIGNIYENKELLKG